MTAWTSSNCFPEIINDRVEIESLIRLKERSKEMSAEERLALFDANTRWLDEPQADQLKKAKIRGHCITRENRTREELYEDLARENGYYSADWKILSMDVCPAQCG
jgi:hypothetical protein